MTDVFTKSKRSDVMRQIRGRGNKTTEIQFARLLRAHRITGWRRHASIRLPSAKSAGDQRDRSVKPDFVFKKHRLAVFIDGCFWHGCLIHCIAPKANAEFWASKLLANRRRDQLVDRLLRRQDWTVVRFWEHQLSRADWVVTKLRLKLAPPVSRSR